VVLVHEEFAGLWADHGPEAFRKFREQEGRKFRFSTFPKGSVAFVVLQYWLREEVGVSRDLVEIETLGGAGPVRQSLLSGNADGTFIMEPIPTALQAKDAPFEWLTYTGEFMSGQPGGVMFMHDRLWEDDPDLARAIVERHVRATGVINDEPDTAARAVSETLGDKLPLKIARQAVRSKASNYISAPGKIESGTQLFVDEMRSLGQIEEAVDNDTIFEPSLYDEVST
jgi:NitT/TauT family transport system substrate-binding protein